MTKYKAGDEVTVVLTNDEADALNRGHGLVIRGPEIISHKPKHDLLDEAEKELCKHAYSESGRAVMALHKVLEYLRELRKVN